MDLHQDNGAAASSVPGSQSSRRDESNTLRISTSSSGLVNSPNFDDVSRGLGSRTNPLPPPRPVFRTSDERPREGLDILPSTLVPTDTATNRKSTLDHVVPIEKVDFDKPNPKKLA